MEEVYNQPAGDSGKNKQLTYLAIIVVMALVIIVLFVWMSKTRSHLNTLVTEKENQRVELKHELDSLMVEHERVKLDYGQLSDSLIKRDSVIQANAVEIKRLLDTEWEYYKVRKKLSQLQLVAQGYVRQMDSLYRMNESLTEENVSIRKDLKELRKEKDQVEKDKAALTEKVEMASLLMAYNMVATGVRYKAGGESEVPTDKAQKADQVKVCFTLSENEIISPGNKDIYIRIARPDKEVLTKSKIDEFTFVYEGKKIQYSMKQSVSYDNKPIDLCLYWKKNYSSQDMMPGLYHVDVFCDGAVIGHTTFTLK
jgi:myosin heavy subunit